MEMEVVWDGTRDNPARNGGYLNTEFYPKRDAPALGPPVPLPVLMRRVTIMDRVVQRLRKGPATVQDLMDVVDHRCDGAVRHCLKTLRLEGRLQETASERSFLVPLKRYWLR